jgi:hypothetical protein
MDTKTLLDWLLEDGGKVSNYSPEDAGQVWIDRMMKEPEYLADYWLDMLEEEFNEDEDGHIKKIFESAAMAKNALDRLSDRRVDDHYRATMATSYAFHCQNIGSAMLQAIIKQLDSYVMDRCEEWFGDVAAYEYEMREGDRIDWAYEQHRDRMLEERE